MTSLYLVPEARIIDVTYGKGVFWQQIPSERYKLITSDLYTPVDVRADFRCLPYPDNSFDAAFLDPPYMYRSINSNVSAHDAGYNTKQRVEDGIYGKEKVHRFFEAGMLEARRVLKSGGYLFVKCMDQIMGGKQQRQHIHIWRFAIEVLGMLDVDLFVLVQKGKPIMRHKYQLHSRKNQSFCWVFRK
jgi:hypothetical protein